MSFYNYDNYDGSWTEWDNVVGAPALWAGGASSNGSEEGMSMMGKNDMSSGHMDDMMRMMSQMNEMMENCNQMMRTMMDKMDRHQSSRSAPKDG